jgi:hypothetical protein
MILKNNKGFFAAMSGPGGIGDSPGLGSGGRKKPRGNFDSVNFMLGHSGGGPERSKFTIVSSQNDVHYLKIKKSELKVIMPISFLFELYSNFAKKDQHRKDTFNALGTKIIGRNLGSYDKVESSNLVGLIKGQKILKKFNNLKLCKENLLQQQNPSNGSICNKKGLTVRMQRRSDCFKDVNFSLKKNRF